MERHTRARADFEKKLPQILKAERDNRKTVIFPTTGGAIFAPPPDPRYAGLKSYDELYEQRTGTKLR